MAKVTSGRRKCASKKRATTKHTSPHKKQAKKPSTGKKAGKLAAAKKAARQTLKPAEQQLKAHSKSSKKLEDKKAGIAEKLAHALEKRKTQSPDGKTPPVKPKGRRGRRPKALAEYTPTHNEEDVLGADFDYQGLEYDTGITVSKSRDEGAFSLDSVDEIEELNFDY
jgi:hypothetical protein